MSRTHDAPRGGRRRAAVIAAALALAVGAAGAGCEGTETGNPDLATAGIGDRPPLGGNPSLDGGVDPPVGGGASESDAGDPPVGSDGGVGQQDAGAGDADGGGDFDAGTP